jgi:hypothetical protein
MTDDRTAPIDHRRSACLCDLGSDYTAAVVIDASGTEYLLLVHRDEVGRGVVYDAGCSTVGHEQLGPLPIEFVHRITVSRRTHRCGRPTKSGAPCQTQVTRPGDACGWHRTGARK